MDLLTLKCRLLCGGISEGAMPIGAGRRGGAGPAGLCIDVDGMLVNIPNNGSVRGLKADGECLIDGAQSWRYHFISRPGFYDKTTSEGVPMGKVALLHGRDCLATTLYQGCYFKELGSGCGFCAIETTLKSGRTILKKSPEQLLEVAGEAQKEGVKHITLTTGTPNLEDHGALIMGAAVQRLKESLDLPIHVQLTPPGKRYIHQLYSAGADTIGIHVETLDKDVLKRVCPGKVGFDYQGSLKEALAVFGENQVSSFVIAGMGENVGKTIQGLDEMASQGVIPFLVPFRPLSGTGMEGESPPDPLYMRELYMELADSLDRYGLKPWMNKAGCVRCGACSALDMALNGR